MAGVGGQCFCKTIYIYTYIYTYIEKVCVREKREREIMGYYGLLWAIRVGEVERAMSPGD